MRFLLVAVNSKYIHSNPAIYSLRAYAQTEGIPENGEVVLAQYTINEQVEDILHRIYEEKPDVIGFSCYIWNIRYVRLLVEDLAEVLPQVPVWLGGPEVSYCAEEILQTMPGVTGVMIGEGEKTFSKLLGYYCGRGNMEGIEGIAYRKGQTVVYTAPVQPLKLSDVPFLYHDLDGFSNQIIYYESSRGCPYRCSYCLSSIEKQVRFRDLKLVYEELDFFLQNRVKQVKFIDRTFNIKPDRSLAIWRYLIEHDNGITNFHFELSADLLTEAEFQIFQQMRPGLIQLEIGVQTTNPKTMEAIRRYASFEKISRAVKRIRETGRIHQHLDLIAGLPYEGYESFGRSFDDVYRLRPDQLQLGFLKVLKGSYLYEKAEAYGIVYSKRPPYEVLFTRWLSFEDILQLKAVESVVETYYNSGQFSTSIAYLETFFDRPFLLYEALGAFCSRGNYAYQAHSRMRQYEQLLLFAEEIPGIDRAVLISGLVHDCYLRENCKSRPSFALEQGMPGKDAARVFYQEEAQRPVYLTGYQGYNSRQMANMTHLECYPVDVLQLRQGRLVCRPVTVLYDYLRRDGFSHDGTALEVHLI